MIKRLPSPEHADTLSLKALRSLVNGLVDRVEGLSAGVRELRVENAALREENEILRLDNGRLKVENQMLRDEIARLKDLPPRPPFRPSGMDKATDVVSAGRPRPKKPRGPKLDVKRINPPAGSRFKGYRSYTVRDLTLMAEIVRYRRECWITPEGRTVLAPLPAGVVGGYGANLRRICMMLHAQGQVTTQRLTTLLNDIGVDVSKRQVLRLLTRGMNGLAAEDAAVLHAGLVSSDYVTVDDTGARHFHKNAYATQIGGPNKIRDRKITPLFPDRQKPWTTSAERVLRMLWDFYYPASEIGRVLHKSRSAVIGKARRLKLPSRHKIDEDYVLEPRVEENAELEAQMYELDKFP